MADNEKKEQKPAKKQVLFAKDASTVHILLSPDPVDDPFGGKTYNTESKLLLPGEYVGTDKVPPYLLEKVKDGSADTLVLMDEAKAVKLANEAARIRAQNAESVNVVGPGAAQAADTYEHQRAVAEAVEAS